MFNFDSNVRYIVNVRLTKFVKAERYYMKNLNFSMALLTICMRIE